MEKELKNEETESKDEIIKDISNNMGKTDIQEQQKLHGRYNRLLSQMKEHWESNPKSMPRNIMLPLIFFIGSVIYLEGAFHLLIYQSLDLKFIYPVLFAIPFGILLTLITGCFRERTNKILQCLLTVLICLIYQVQLVYYSVFKMFFSFQSLGLAEDAFSNFYTEVVDAVRGNIGGLILLAIPIVAFAILMYGSIDYRKRGYKRQGILLCGFAFFHVLAVLLLLLAGRKDYSPYDLYYFSRVPDLSGKQLGIVTMTRLDFEGIFSNTGELVLADTCERPTETIIPTGLASVAPSIPAAVVSKAPEEEITISAPSPSPTPTPTPVDTSPNILNINFAALAQEEKNQTIKTLHNYFASAIPTNKNKYTGMYRGYNLIMITAEGFSPYAVREDLTPTLYQLIHEGFVFKNFYTALWQTSTSDGEYTALTGLIPTGTRSMYTGRKNLWPFSLGNQFKKLGVESKAYHDHSYTYYQRNETHTNLGYLWKAKGNGLELVTDCWPESDLEMINATVQEYEKEKQFHVYYLTVSGHMNYTFSGNSMASKNRKLVEKLPYSEEVKAYIACQIELDRALEALIDSLKKAGVADRTVIALSADHYPYGWNNATLEEAAGHEIDPVFEIYRNHFILWCAGNQENIVIDKPCSSLDILPTLSNLFGLEYDSRLLMGQDILSDFEPMVVLSNRSFITDKVMYNSATGESTVLAKEPLPEDYIKNQIGKVKNMFSVSKSILEEDYYRYLYPNSR